MGRRIRFTSFAALGTFGALVFATSACDKLGLGKKDGDGGTTASGSGGGLLAIFDKSFEGEVTMLASGKDAGKGGPKTLVFGLKTPKVRVDANSDLAPTNPMFAQGVAFIVDPPAKKAYALIAAKKQAVVIDLDKAKTMKLPTMPGSAGPSGPSAPSVPSEPPKIEKTGQKDTVAGYQCEIWKITNKNGSRAEACLAEGIKWIDLTDLGVQSPEIAAAAALSDMNHFPLRLVSWDPKNVEEARLEAQKIDKKKLDDTRFGVPADYQVIDISQLFGSILGAPSGRPGMPPGLPPGFVPPSKRSH